MTNKKYSARALMVTIFLISLIQMPHLMITPGIARISQVFSEWPEQTIQTAMSLPNVISVFGGVFAALAVRYGIFGKKTLAVAGMLVVSLSGVAALILHTEFWQLWLLNAFIGAGMGMFIPMTQSIMFDNFDEKTRQFATGVQSSVINIGGIIMSLLGGLLVGVVWYGGHLMTLVSIPVAIVALIVIPKDKKQTKRSAAKTKLPRDAYYYSAVLLIFMVLYNVGAYNLAMHMKSGGIDDPGIVATATAAMMAGGALSGFLFPVLSPRLRDHLFCVSLSMMAIGYTLMNLFPSSLAVTIIAMALCGASLSLLIPRCVFSVSNLTDVSNSATATMFIASIAPGIGSFLSPLIITNATIAIDSAGGTRFRYQFTAVLCVVVAAAMLLNNIRRDRRAARAGGTP